VELKMAKMTLADISVGGIKVLMRVDFNVPLKDGKVADERRIVAALPSIRTVLDQGGQLVLMSHLGRPDGAWAPEGSLDPCARRLGELLGRKVQLGPREVIGPEALALALGMVDGDVLMLENVRFHPGETMPDKAKKNPDKKLTPEQQRAHDDFVAGLAGLGAVYVNDAFGTCHRKHASMYGVAKAIRKKGGRAVAGYLLEKEIKYLHDAVATPKPPFVAVLGGAKVSDKIKLIANLLPKVDRILVGGAMAYTLLKAGGTDVGKSRVEEDQIAEMKSLLASAGNKILLPVDHVATADFEAGAPVDVNTSRVPSDLMGMDIGKRTREIFASQIRSAGTIIWNGPMGVFEKAAYAAGTNAVAVACADATTRGATTVVGGGDSAAAVEQMGLAHRMSHVSTGGGASLTYLEGKPMPPIEVLDERQ